MAEPGSWHVLDDGRPGHVNQSLGMLQILDPQLTRVQRGRLSAPRSALKRPVQALLTLCGSSPTLLSLLFRLYYGSPPPTRPDAAVLVSTGGDTLIANMILARLWGLPNVFIGRRSRHTDRQVRLLVTTVGEAVADRVLLIPFAPVLKAVGDPSGEARRERTLAVLIGGDSQEYRYERDDYVALGQALNRLCADQGWQLLLTTSRRTGSEGEAALRATLEPGHLADATWYGEAPRPTAGLYSRQANAILCSEDSGSMLTESLGYGKPVLAFRPRNKASTPFYDRFLAKLAEYQVGFAGLDELGDISLAHLPAARQVDYSRLQAALQALLTTPSQ